MAGWRSRRGGPAGLAFAVGLGLSTWAYGLAVALGVGLNGGDVQELEVAVIDTFPLGALFQSFSEPLN